MVSRSRFGSFARGALTAVASAAIGSAWSSSAVAAEPSAPAAAAVDVWSRHFAASAQVGLGTPTGYYGLTVEGSPTPWLVLSAGIGIGSGRLRGWDCLPAGTAGVCTAAWHESLQIAAMWRIRALRLRHGALALGTGLSAGAYHWDELTTDAPAHKSAELAKWWNLEASWEERADWGGTLRGFVGYGWMLNPGDLKCIDTGVNPEHCREDHAGDGESLVYIGVALGIAF